MASILITGCSSGIGHALAKALAEQDHLVYAGIRKEADKQLFEDNQNITPVILDVTNQNHIREVTSYISNNTGLDVLINNAGIIYGGPIEALSIDQLRQVFEVNVFAVFNMLKNVLPLLQKSQGRVINISSISGRIGLPFMSPYCSSKFALEAITDCLRREASDFGIKVISINPGSIKTDIWEKSTNQIEIIKKQLNPDAVKNHAEKIDILENKLHYNAKNAQSVSLVVQAVVNAIESKQPKTRYFVGKGIKFQALLTKLLSDTLLDRKIANWLK